MPKVKCICETCKKEYLIQQWYFRGAFRWQTKFCSQWCRAEKTTQNNCVCRTCGKEFYKYPCEISVNNYCSRECYKKRVGHPNHQFPTYVEKNALLVVKNLRQNHLKSKEDLAYIAQKIVSISRKMEKLKVFVCNVELNLFIQEQGTLNIVAINAGELQHQKKNLYFGKVAKHQK